MDTVKAGKPFRDVIKLCVAADRPLLAIGGHGIGKSEQFEQVAKELKIGFICLDLSLMEPVDLVGLPKAKGSSTIYLPPAFLPRSGRGLLVFEELNRCERFMRAPCLQLLTTRTLNDYTLPPGWLPVAAVNPSGDGYEVSEMDRALLSRFAQFHVVPDQEEWLAWARHSDIHPAVIDYVESDSTVFNTPDSSPRSWHYVSTALQAAEKEETSRAALRAVVLGLVDNTRGAAFLRTLKKTDRPLTAKEVLGAYQEKHRGKLRRWIKQGHLDLVESTLLTIQKFLQPKAAYEDVRNGGKLWNNLGRFLDDLPGDLHASLIRFFVERSYKIPKRRSKEQI